MSSEFTGDARSERYHEVLLILEPEIGSEDDEREELVRQLGVELRELDVEALSSSAGRPAPARSKGVETWGDWLITLSASGGVFTTLLVTVQNWLDRHRGAHKVKVVIDGDTLELSGATTAEQARIVRAFLSKHSGT